MTGGAIDADYLGIVANAAEFNPFVVRLKSGKVLGSGILFTLEVTESRGWLNISKCVFHAIADGYFRASRTAFQTDRGRRFKPIVDAVSA
jgi:hypothetical protein